VVFLGYVVSKEGMSMDESTVEPIKSWLTITNITKVWSFHEMSFFYQLYIKLHSYSPSNTMHEKNGLFLGQSQETFKSSRLCIM